MMSEVKVVHEFKFGPENHPQSRTMQVGVLGNDVFTRSGDLCDPHDWRVCSDQLVASEVVGLAAKIEELEEYQQHELDRLEKAFAVEARNAILQARVEELEGILEAYAPDHPALEADDA